MAGTAQECKTSAAVIKKRRTTELDVDKHESEVRRRRGPGER